MDRIDVWIYNYDYGKCFYIVLSQNVLKCEKRSIALDNVQKIAEALEIETYLLFVEDKSQY